VIRAALLASSAALALAACGTSADDGDTVTVLAASSLMDAFEEIGEDFESERADVEVEFGLAASSELAAQIEQGAPADVFASADDVNMQRVVDSGDVNGEPIVFARNRLAIAVEDGNPKDITGLADFDRDDVIVVLCAEQVPCGRYADEVLARAGMTFAPASREENVKAAVTRIALGEADAAIVYATDVRANADVEAVSIPDGENILAEYSIATLAAPGDDETSEAFVRFVRSRAGERVLREHGFLAP
jgi:molybdate transport system substrate-binding protein